MTVGSNAPGSLVVLGGITGALTVTGGGSDALTLDDGGDSLPRVGTLTATSLTGVGPTPIGFSGLASLVLNLGVSNDNLTVNDTIAGTTTVNAGSGNDTLTVLHDSGPTTLNGGPGADTFNLRATGAVTTIDTGSTGGANIINVGGTAPTAGGVLSGIAGEIHLAGDGSDTLNIDDSGDATGQVGNISATAVSGLSPAAIDYASVANLNVNLGDGGDTLTVTGTAAGQTTINGHSGADTFNIRAINSTTTVNSGTGANTVNVGSLAPASGGVLSGISTALTLNGGGSDILNFDDSGDAANTTESLSGNGLSGLTPTPITYGGAAAVNLALGFGNDALTVTNTEAGATTHVTTGTGTDTVTVVNDAGPTTIDAGSGADNVYIRRTGATTTVNHAAGAAGTILVGSNAPSAASTLKSHRRTPGHQWERPGRRQPGRHGQCADQDRHALGHHDRWAEPGRHHLQPSGKPQHRPGGRRRHVHRQRHGRRYGHRGCRRGGGRAIQRSRDHGAADTAHRRRHGSDADRQPGSRGRRGTGCDPGRGHGERRERPRSAQY